MPTLWPPWRRRRAGFPGIEYETKGYAAASEVALDEATITKIEAMVEKMMADTGTPCWTAGIDDGRTAYREGFVLDVLANTPAAARSGTGLCSQIPRGYRAHAVGGCGQD